MKILYKIIAFFFKPKEVVFNPKEINDFKIGHVYKMKVGERSHVRRPYYVEIIDSDDVSITTNIPGEHSLIITKSGITPNWRYHIGRFEYVGSKFKYGYLLFNQNLT